MSWYLTAGPESDVILSSRVRLARNILNYPFSNRMDDRLAQQLADEICSAIYAANAQMPALYQDIDLPDMDDTACLALIERRLISDELLRGRKGRSRRTSRVLIRRDEAVSVMIGEEDHLRIQAMTPGLDLDQANRLAEEMAVLIEEKMAVAYSEQYGFLTACPTNTGTGMRASVMAHLPGLTEIGQIAGLKRRLERLGFAVRGAYGEGSDAGACQYQISNQVTLGLSEADILTDLKHIVQQVMVLERQARQKLKEQSGPELDDRMARNLAVLRSARLMSYPEALRRISDLALGVDLDLIQEPGLGPETIKQMLNQIGPWTLARQIGHPLEETARRALRADVLRQLSQPPAPADGGSRNNTA